MTAKIEQFLKDSRPSTPCLVVDLDRMETNYHTLRRVLPLADIYYAVKANPARPVLDRLVAIGSCFDAASFNEIRACLDAGAAPSHISYGNTIKKATDIAAAHAEGITLFAFDSDEELEKLAENAPGAKVYCRILVDNSGADWPLSKKFGCAPDMAAELMVRARDMGLQPYGLSFHVGSQQTQSDRWAAAIGQVAMIFSDLRRSDIQLEMINIGGGYPITYNKDVPPMESFGATIIKALEDAFGNAMPAVIAEPGRALVGDAGIMETEVVLVSIKNRGDDRRWVYLDVGLFTGLAETMDEAIRYSLETDKDGDPLGPVIIAGPTCDGADILYREAGYQLPQSLRSGDRLRILAAGAYTTPYAARWFNGFPPPEEIYL